jgi:very-short-patch-repair endonuclease
MNTIGYELRQEESIRQRYRTRLGVFGLADLFEIQLNRASMRKALRFVADRKALKAEYAAVTELLNRRHGLERQITPAEDSFFGQFSKAFRIKLYRQVWVGNLCLDFFIPALGLPKANGAKGFSLKGLAVEVDGQIHDTIMKSKKDEFKEKSLHDLGILVWRISNDQVFGEECIPSRAAFRHALKPLCSKARADLWSMIYLVTVLYHSSDEALNLLWSKPKTASVAKVAV